MPLLILGKDPSNYLKSDPTLSSLRATTRPFETNKNWMHVATKSGTIAAATAGGSPLFTLQNISNNLLAIKRVKVCFSMITWATAQYVDFGLQIARNITAVQTGGTAIALTGNNCKLMAEGASLSAVNCRVATTGTLTAGTRTLDTNYIGMTGNWSAAVGTPIPLTTIFEALPGKYPIILALNEGIEIQLLTTLGTTNTGVLGVTIEFAETNAY